MPGSLHKQNTKTFAAIIPIKRGKESIKANYKYTIMFTESKYLKRQLVELYFFFTIPLKAISTSYFVYSSEKAMKNTESYTYIVEVFQKYHI